MGWKTFKQKYNIDHIVQITGKGICIGSGYCHDLATVDLITGSAKENPTFRGFLERYYPKIMTASQKEILETIHAEDSFENDIKVYTFEGSEIIEKKCEKFGYPNITHDGFLMYENTYFKTRIEAIEKALDYNNSSLKYYEQALKEAEASLSGLKSQISKCVLDDAKLKILKSRCS